MTHSGGLTHEVGDRGQRYEVTFFDKTENRRRPLGWTNSHKSALQMMAAVDANPSWEFPQVRDRKFIDEPLSAAKEKE